MPTLGTGLWAADVRDRVSKVMNVKDLNIVNLLNIDRMAQRRRLFLPGEYHRAEKVTGDGI